MDIQNIDGTYSISTISDYNGPIEKRSDGITEVKNGQTHRVDDAGCVWTTTLKYLNENEVEFTSVADPSNADTDFLLRTESGDLTREPVTYQTILRVDRIGERIKLSGQIEHGGETTVITMIKQV